MGKRALGLCLFLLSLILSIGPILLGLAAYNWNFMNVVTPEADTLSELMEAKPALGIENVDASLQEITLKFENLPLRVKIKDCSGEIFCVTHNLHLGSVALKEQVTIYPQSGTFTLIATLTQDNIHLTYSVILKNLRIEMDMYGISVIRENLLFG
jgi:hypothetical protein